MPGGISLRSTAVYAALALAAGVAAYFALFTGFPIQDDEGTVLVSIAAFAEGDVLYRDVYSPYGPFYFELFGSFFALTGLPVSTDASRLLVIVMWVGASLLLGLTVQRATGRLTFGAIAMVGAFSTLRVLTSEPMHPQGLSIVMLALFTLILVAGGRRPAAAGYACGALLGALLMTKLNLGAFAIAAVALAAVIACPPLARRRWLSVAVAIAFLAMPIVVMERDLGDSWALELAALEVLGAGALIAAAWPSGLRRDDGTDETVWRWLVAFAIALAAATVAILAVAVLTGPSVADLYDGMVVEAMRVRDVLVVPLNMRWPSLALALLGLVGAVILRRRPQLAEGPSLWPALARGAAGLAILVLSTASVPAELELISHQDTLVWSIALAWLVAVPPHRDRLGQYERFVRVLLPALAIAESLQAYPVAGSQVRIAAALFVPLGMICLNDALLGLREWGAARGRERLLGGVAPVAVAVVAGALIVGVLGRTVVDSIEVYDDDAALPFPNASLLHLPPEDVENYTRVVERLKGRCADFVGYPNVNSLYLWSGIDPPPPVAPGAWIEALDDERQQRVVDYLRRSPRPCVVRNPVAAQAWLGKDAPPDAPLVRLIEDQFRPVEAIGGFEFMLPARVRGAAG